MPELSLHRAENSLEITFGEHHTTVPWVDVAPDATMGQRIYDDAVGYGKILFAKTFAHEPLKHALTALQANERLVLVIDDPQVAAIPWEYLRDHQERLLAARLTLVRSVPDVQQYPSSFTLPLHIIAIPVSPVDDSRVLDTEGEWQRVLAAVKKQGKALILTRVRPPTLEGLERTLHSGRTTIVHFMGHSDNREGKGLLVFEETYGRSYLIEASEFADTLAATTIFLVVLNSCRSAVAWDWTAFGNIAGGLVRAGVPYALGMQFLLPDDAALAVSQSLYDFLLQGRSIEEAVRRTRRTLEHNTALHNAPWLAGIPVLYTSLHEQPVASLKLFDGQPTIQPNPDRLQKTCDLAALPQATHFVGRSKEISQALGALLDRRPTDFVVLHGLGGIGKTSLAREVAERVSWYFDDRVLAISFETFAGLDVNGQRTIDETFAEGFYNRLAHFYELEPTQYSTTTELQQAILQRRTYTRSLLVLDNIETLIDAQKQDYPAAKVLATFVSRLKEGDGAILLTSRIVPPSDWGNHRIIDVSGLTDDAGGSLLLALLRSDRRLAALPNMHRKLSQRVKGHPLSIRLLAGRFDESTTDLETFLKEINAELQLAEQTTPTSLEDPERQATLYACMDYSVKRLTVEQKKVLDAVSLFQAGFIPEFASYLMNGEDQTTGHLQSLVRLSLLNMQIKTFEEGELTLFELHPMLRWYIQHHLQGYQAPLLELYGDVFLSLAKQSYEPEGGYDQSSLMRYLMRQSLPDCEAALHFLPPANKSKLAYYLSEPYERLGQYRRALALLEQSLEIDQELGNVSGVAIRQRVMANMLRQQGKSPEALALLEQSLQAFQALGDVRAVALAQISIARVLVAQGKSEEALALYEESLRTSRQLGDMRTVETTQHSMAEVLVDQGKPEEALALYEQSLQTFQASGDVRAMAITQYAIAKVLMDQGKPEEALALYEQSLQTFQVLEDTHSLAQTQKSIATVLVYQGKPEEARVLFEQSLQTFQELGDAYNVAVTQASFGQLLLQQGEYRRGLTMCWEAYVSVSQNNATYQIQRAQEVLISIKSDQLEPEQFNSLWAEIISEPQPDWLLNVETSSSSESTDISPEHLKFFVAHTIRVMTTMPEKKAEWRESIKLLLLLAQDSAEFLTAIIAILDGQASSLPEDHAYAAAFNEIQAGIAAGVQQREDIAVDVSDELMQAVSDFVNANDWPVLREDHPSTDASNESQAGIAAGGQQGRNDTLDVSDELMQAVLDFVNAEDWDATRQVVEAHQALLFQPEVEALFEENIASERSAGEQQSADVLEQHLALLRACKTIGIAEAFEQLEEEQEAELPFDDELIPRSIATLLGSPQEKMAHAQYLIEQTNNTTDQQLKALLQVIQLALFGSDLSQLGRDLQGVYRQAWDSIAVPVESGGVDLETFELIANNTLAVLGPASNRRNEWRANLIGLRNQATVQGNRNMVALLEAVIGLLDAGGDAQGLGVGLKGIYAQTWQAIVEHL